MGKVSLFGVLAAFPLAALASFRAGCADAPWDSATDFWNFKFATNPQEAPFSVLYNNTFAQLRVRNAPRRQVILHCTNEAPPADVLTAGALVVKVPVENVAALDGFTQNLIDMLGMSQTIRHVGTFDALTPDCMRVNIHKKVTYEEGRWDEAPAVDVTFHSNASNFDDTSKVAISNQGEHAPLIQLGWLRYISMFYGLEETASQVYDQIASNYRCAAAQVQNLIAEDQYPTGAFISGFERTGNDALTVFQTKWFEVFAADAGSKLVNSSTDSAETVEVEAADVSSNFAKQSWALIDTTQYQFPVSLQTDPLEGRPDAAAWAQLSGIPENIYAVQNANVWLADKHTSRQARHNFFDRAGTRPDLALRDIISIVNPEYDPSYTRQFLRHVSQPQDAIYALPNPDTACTSNDTVISGLNLTQCVLGVWGDGYLGSGVEPNTYGRDQSISSLASPSSSSASQVEEKDSNGLSGGQKAGIAVGSVVGGLLIIGLALLLWKKQKGKKSEVSMAEKGTAQTVRKPSQDATSTASDAS